MTVTRRIRSPGRARYKPLKPLRAGMPGDLGATCGDYARVLCFISHARLWVRRAPGIPHALCFLWANESCTTRAHRAAGMRAHALSLFEIKSNTKHARRPGLEPGPITTGRDVARGWSGIPQENEQRWLWVPAFAGTTGRANLLARLDPFRRASPQRVAMLGAEETKMADLGRAGIGGRDGEDFRLGRRKSRAQKFDRRARRPGVVGKAQRAQRALKFRKILQRLELVIVEQIALAHDPAGPLQKHALRQIFAQPAPARRIAQQAGEGGAYEIQHGIDAVAFRRGHQLPVSGLRRDQQRARDLAVVGKKSQRLAAEGMA